MCVYFSAYHEVPYCWYEVHILTRSYEKTSSILVTTSQNGKLTIPHGFRQFWQYLPCNFERNFFSGVIVLISGQRKAIEVTFVSFGLYARRFTVECAKYATRLFSYFDIFKYVSSNFTLNSRIRIFAVSHGLAALHLLC